MSDKLNGQETQQSPPIIRLAAWRRAPAGGDLVGFADVELVEIGLTLRGCALWRNGIGICEANLPSKPLQARTGPRWIPMAMWSSREQKAAFSAEVVALVRHLDPNFDQPAPPSYSAHR